VNSGSKGSLIEKSKYSLSLTTVALEPQQLVRTVSIVTKKLGRRAAALTAPFMRAGNRATGAALRCLRYAGGAVADYGWAEGVPIKLVVPDTIAGAATSITDCQG
jgi:hypothetical protein